MTPEKVEKGYLSRAFRKAIVTGLAALALTFGAQAQNSSRNNNVDDDDIYYTTSSNTKATVNTPTVTTPKTDSTAEPWQKDSSYVREMNLALKAYQAKVLAVNEKLREDTLRIKRERYISSSGHIDLMHVLMSGPKTKSDVIQVKSYAATQLSNLETSYNYQKDNIEEKYKQKYEREQAQILRMKKATATNTPAEEKIMLEKKDLDLAKKQLELEKQKLELEKQKAALEQQKKDFEKKQQQLLLPPKQ
ncbi:MAG: hypothetical protein K8R48_07755 [Alphaproteobacteria bacterium]|nr:hypothetical protein [Alphaproteobacteria bacterium]